jgi:hypothetical protein
MKGRHHLENDLNVFTFDPLVPLTDIAGNVAQLDVGGLDADHVTANSRSDARCPTRAQRWLSAAFSGLQPRLVLVIVTPAAGPRR